MSLQEQIKKDLMESIKSRNVEKTHNLKIIFGEFSRQKDKELKDDTVISILTKIKKDELEVLKYKYNEISSTLIDLIDTYLPEQVSIEEIKTWIKDNIDFSSLKNKMQAVGIVMKQFGKVADGNEVKRIIENEF